MDYSHQPRGEGGQDADAAAVHLCLDQRHLEHNQHDHHTQGGEEGGAGKHHQQQAGHRYQVKSSHQNLKGKKTYLYLPSVSPLVEVKEEKSFLYAESKRAKLEREKEERRQRMEEDFSPEDLALATVPGYDFDPKERAFQMDELRPQPIIRWHLSLSNISNTDLIRKRKMVAVPEEHKDEKYWEKRLKNKEATRRSREAKRLKQNQIALRAAHLERENKSLRDQIEAAKK